MTKTYGNIENVQYIRNYDGDTITITINNIPPVFGHEVGVRVNGVDTPEIRGKTNCEKTLAKEAKNFVNIEVETATHIDLVDVARDKYFRILANVSYIGKDLSLELLNNHLAVSYDGGKKEMVDWCVHQNLFHATPWYIDHEHDLLGDL